MAEDFDPKEYRRKLKEERKRLKQLQKEKKAEMKRRRKEMKLAKIRMKEAALTGRKPDVLPKPSKPAEPASGAAQPETTTSVPPEPSAVNQTIPWVKRSRLSIKEIEMRVDAIDLTKGNSLEERLDAEHKTLFDLYAKRFGEELDVPSEYKDKSLLLDLPEDVEAGVEIKASKDNTPSDHVDSDKSGKKSGGVMSKIKGLFSKKESEE